MAAAVVSFNDPGVISYEGSVVAPGANTVLDHAALEETASALPGRIGARELRGQIELTADSALQTVTVSARAQSGQQAVRIVDAFTPRYVEARRAAIRAEALRDQRAAERQLARADSRRAREGAQARLNESDLIVAWVDILNPRMARRGAPVSAGGTTAAIRGAGIAAFIGLVLAAGLVRYFAGRGRRPESPSDPSGTHQRANA